MWALAENLTECGIAPYLSALAGAAEGHEGDGEAARLVAMVGQAVPSGGASWPRVGEGYVSESAELFSHGWPRRANARDAVAAFGAALSCAISPRHGFLLESFVLGAEDHVAERFGHAAEALARAVAFRVLEDGRETPEEAARRGACFVLGLWAAARAACARWELRGPERHDDDARAVELLWSHARRDDRPTDPAPELQKGGAS